MKKIALVLVLCVVAIGSIYLFKYTSGKIEKVQLDEQSVVESNTKKYAVSDSEKTGWKTYTNLVYDFSLDYPETWIFENLESYRITFRSEAGGPWVFQVDVFENTTNNTLQDIKGRSGDELLIDTDVSATATSQIITIDGQSARQFSYQAPKGYSYYGDTETFIIHDNNLYTIATASGANPVEAEVLKSFRFTE